MLAGKRRYFHQTEGKLFAASRYLSGTCKFVLCKHRLTNSEPAVFTAQSCLGTSFGSLRPLSETVTRSDASPQASRSGHETAIGDKTGDVCAALVSVCVQRRAVSDPGLARGHIAGRHTPRQSAALVVCQPMRRNPPTGEVKRLADSPSSISSSALFTM